MTVVAGIVVAGGEGQRFDASGSSGVVSGGGLPKQFCPLGAVRVVDLAVGAALASCDEVVLVVPVGTEWDGSQVDAVVTGGPTRSASVRNGLAAVGPDAEIVVVHDAARPLAGPELFEAVIAAVRNGADAAVPGVPLADTIKRVEDGRVVETVARAGLVGVQTPQAFRATVLRAAHAAGDDATDDANLVETAGATVVVVPGDPRNLKITTPADLELAATLMARSDR